MTETTNTVNQDNSGADVAPKDDVKGFIQVYKSTDENPCEVWFAPRDAEIIRPYTQIPPDPDLKDPKFDFINYKWLDLGGATQAQKLNSLAEKIESLQQDVADGKVNQEEINQNLGTLTDLVSAVAGTFDTEEGTKNE
ncbi:hypothetical protein F5ESL0263_03775 [Lactobacillus sp. ESL0263]|uniref:hypothetical protein n=1 Tax=Lactobacillus sp. ESL0263 TaxID=2069350 RepID=UPI000EFA9158|nr:hypothetical protein [Lactobacillus sp. ESL0263]RMC50141.1 hypothetical protein F5ESL0263_03775 [Lactobacillus sp. ESL0263]